MPKDLDIIIVLVAMALCLTLVPWLIDRLYAIAYKRPEKR